MKQLDTFYRRIPMRYYITFIMYLVFFQGNVNAQLAPSDPVEWGEQYRIIKEHTRMLNRMINSNVLNNETVPFEIILPEIRKVEDITKNHPILYLESMEWITGQLQNRSEEKNVVLAAKEIVARAPFLPLEKEKYNLAEYTNGLSYQFQMLLQPYFFPSRTSEIIGFDPELRRKNANRLLELYQLILSQIEEDYDPLAPGNIPQFKGFIPPDSHRGHVISGMDYSNVDDEATREAYKKYMEELWVKYHKGEAYNVVKDVRKHGSQGVAHYLIDAYSLLPYRTSELEQLLTDRKFDSELSKMILDKVRRAEQGLPEEETNESPKLPPELSPEQQAAQQKIIELFEQHFEAERTGGVSPFPVHVKRDPNEGKRTNVTITTITKSKEDLREPYVPYPLPKPSQRWKIVLLVNGAIFCAIFALYFYLRWRRQHG